MSDSTAPNVVDKYKAQIKAGSGAVDIIDLQTGNIRSIRARAGIDNNTVDDYAAQMTGVRGRGNTAAEFPYVRIWQVGPMGALYLTSGSHRWRAAKAAGKDSLGAEFKTGTYLEALADAVSANATHGLRLNRADIRHCLELLFEHKEYRSKSDNSLARLVGCSPTTVGKVRAELDADQAEDKKRVDAKGRQINTSKIGRKPKKAAPLSKVDSEDEPPLCCACELQDAVDGRRCQKCIDTDRQPEDDAQPDDEPEVIDDGDEDDEPTDSPAQKAMVRWNKGIESLARKIDALDAPLKSLYGVHTWLDADRIGRISRSLNMATRELRAVKGHKTCPKCAGAHDGCEFCHETGFVPRAVFDSLEAGE